MKEFCKNCEKNNPEEFKIIDKFKGDPTELIHCLQLIQEHFGYIPERLVSDLSRTLEVPESEVYSVITFYSQFTLNPKAEYTIEVCMGTACYVLGAQKTLQKFENLLKIKMGEQTSDHKFELVQSRCLGCCGLAPVVSVNGEIYGKVEESRVEEILKGLK